MKVKYTRVETMEKDHTYGQIKYMRSRGWNVEEIDGEEPLDFCEVCGRPIMDGQPMQGDRNGVVWHVQCPTDERK